VEDWIMDHDQLLMCCSCNKGTDLALTTSASSGAEQQQKKFSKRVDAAKSLNCSRFVSDALVALFYKDIDSRLFIVRLHHIVTTNEVSFSRIHTALLASFSDFSFSLFTSEQQHHSTTLNLSQQQSTPLHHGPPTTQSTYRRQARWPTRRRPPSLP
jgi:hypothetical protein